MPFATKLRPSVLGLVARDIDVDLGQLSMPSVVVSADYPENEAKFRCTFMSRSTDWHTGNQGSWGSQSGSRQVGSQTTRKWTTVNGSRNGVDNAVVDNAVRTAEFRQNDGTKDDVTQTAKHTAKHNDSDD